MMETTVKRPPARILAIETASPRGSVAADAGAGVVERRLDEDGQHGRLVGSGLEEVAIAAGFAVETVEVVAVVRGPGSFTGLRVGVTTAKALAWASGARLVGVSGFEVIAGRTARLTGRADTEIEIAYDAGRGDVYAATVAPAASGWRVGDPRLLPADAWLASLPPGRLVSGPAIDQLADRMTGRTDLTMAPPEARQPGAGDAAAAARIRAEAGLVDDPQTLVPDYLRPSYAEERRDGGP